MSEILKTLKLRLFTFFKIPLISHVRPTIVSVNDTQCEAIIPLSRRTKNHINAMYFGALAIGADMSIGVLALHHIEKSGVPIVLIFKDFSIDFKKLTKGHAHFHCEEGIKIENLVKQVIATGERQSLPIKGYTTTPDVSGDEVVATFTLTLSLKKK